MVRTSRILIVLLKEFRLDMNDERERLQSADVSFSPRAATSCMVCWSATHTHTPVLRSRLPCPTHLRRPLIHPPSDASFVHPQTPVFHPPTHSPRRPHTHIHPSTHPPHPLVTPRPPISRPSTHTRLSHLPSIYPLTHPIIPRPPL